MPKKKVLLAIIHNVMGIWNFETLSHRERINALQVALHYYQDSMNDLYEM